MFLVQTGLQLRGSQAKLTKLADSRGQLTTEMEDDGGPSSGRSSSSSNERAGRESFQRGVPDHDET